MALQPGDIEKALNNYRETRQIMSPLVDFVITDMLPGIDLVNSKIIEDDEAVAIQLYSSRNVIEVLFVFWLDNFRYSLFVEDKEIIDDYISDEQDVQKSLRCTETILSNDIFRIRFVRNGKIRKVIYRYSVVMENGAIQDYEDQSVMAISMPWHKFEKTEHLFDPWIRK